jgi:DNA-damage-inducible protein J
VISGTHVVTALAVWPQQSYICAMSKTATIRSRIEPSLKSEVEDILSQLGLTASETIQLLYRQIKLQRGLPFDVRIPNALTARTLNASKAGKNVKRFGSKKELFADLGL